jgi:hypothetical protein
METDILDGASVLVPVQWQADKTYVTGWATKTNGGWEVHFLTAMLRDFSTPPHQLTIFAKSEQLTHAPGPGYKFVLQRFVNVNLEFPNSRSSS